MPVDPQPQPSWPPGQLHSDCAIATEARQAKAIMVKRIVVDVTYEVEENKEIVMEKTEDYSKTRLTLYPSIARA
jgi:hypothetical protein